MDASMETPIKTTQSTGHTENMLSTPLFVPPTPMLKELGYGTGKFMCTQNIDIALKVY